MGNHLTHHCPKMDEALRLLQECGDAPKQLPLTSPEPLSEQPLVDEVVEPTPLLVDPTLHSESELNTTQIFYTARSELSEHGGIPLVSSIPPPSHGIISFDWNGFTQSCLPFANPFQIIVRVEPFNVYRSIVDEGAVVTILSLDVWKALGCPELISVTNQLVAFDRRPSEPLGVLPQLPIPLGGKLFILM